ncbi:hypothetical protein BO70DRAFT_354523 [Aspergillus heteromorphus CBS 117.55]|uniref:IgE-binding protein n=1 Tax=Aspergillus heteromorphus CBS 117.55 TaxID=1448321 RepID=A0A317VP59_9EURO|nr:uncharacterized protein BO70DRAFT_354523 [Aspergillus heteromorphus CBS 117.55]PWY75041.1 hypothetical protein BO70DRAFT_354523 [Aspergillus heteromorphus CBS 117.55]
MKFTALPLLAPLALACSEGAFTVLSLRSASPIQYLPLTAADTYFYLGGTTSSACPEEVATYDACPPGNQTDSALVQEIYIAPTGALMFVEAHSDYIIPGSSTATFCYTAGDPIGSWTYSGAGVSGFVACPVEDGAGPYQVFANMPNATVPLGNVADCLGFDTAAVAYTGGIAAWQYD